MNNTAKFWNKIAPKYAKQAVPDQQIYEQKLKLTQDKFNSNMQVLEIGCGTGTTALKHAAKVKHIRAIDISDEMIRIAQEKALKKQVNNVNFKCMAVADIDFLAASYDMVMAHSILHLLKDKDEVIKQTFVTLKPGGWLISSTACLGNKLSFFKWIAPVGKKLGLLPTLNVFTRQDLRESILNAGFNIEHVWQPNSGHTLFIIAQKPNHLGADHE